MAEFISREAAINRIMESLVHQDSHDVNLHNIGLRKAMSAIDSLPAADVVEVVRCLDCVYNRGETKDLWGNPAIKCVTAVTHEPDWYCASGKRKHGGQDE